MKINMIRQTSKFGNPFFVPVGETDRGLCAKWPNETVICVDAKIHRNYGHHRKLFAVLSMAVQNWPNDGGPKTSEELLDGIKVAVGWTEPVWTMAGEHLKRPRSIDYASCDEAEFSEFYNMALGCIGAILGCDPSVLDQNTGSY